MAKRKTKAPQIEAFEPEYREASESEVGYYEMLLERVPAGMQLVGDKRVYRGLNYFGSGTIYSKNMVSVYQDGALVFHADKQGAAVVIGVSALLDI